jgi:NAD(P)-dependent dehydrogenase (short-subunit alcohol dehydrogenase family)
MAIDLDGAAAAQRLAAHGARVVVADVHERGAEVAAAIGGRLARCDVPSRQTTRRRSPARQRLARRLR